MGTFGLRVSRCLILATSLQVLVTPVFDLVASREVFFARHFTLTEGVADRRLLRARILSTPLSSAHLWAAHS